MTMTRAQIMTQARAAMPETVEEILSYCWEKRLPVKLSRNEPAGSCIDASKKRMRGGSIGIPLCDEMKTLVATYSDASGRRECAAVHCRGDRNIDFKAVRQVLQLNGGGRVSLLNKALLESLYGMRYGVCNPLLLDIRSNIRQVFDTGLFAPSESGIPTVMTNAGDFTWGMELLPEDIVRAVSGVIHPITK